MRNCKNWFPTPWGAARLLFLRSCAHGFGSVTRHILQSSALVVGLIALGCASETPEQEDVGEAKGPIVIPSGFQHQVIATGLSQPTAMAIAPDGRIFVTQQAGQVRVIKNNALLPTPFVTVTVDSVNERGLIGITLDPSFASNGHVYVFYTSTSGSTHNRVSRFTASGDVAVPGSEVVLVDFPALSTAGNHNSGALHFGNDGKLYVAHGDNAETAHAQDLNHTFGKIHRFNADGSIPTDNPFYGTSTGLARAIWAYGLRNPFTFSVERASGKIFANDVGGGDPEEINHITRGSNYGHGGGPAPVPPVHSYPRDAGRCAITGGTFYNPTVVNFPSSHVGKYFFADYCSSQIWFMNQDGTGVTAFADDSSGELNNPVDLDVGLDGSLYYLQRGSGARVGRIYVAQPACATDADCSDGDVCTGTETCVAGQCQAGTQLSCDDNDPCTANSCNATSGCTYPDNGQCCTSSATCNDSTTCTTDSCVSGMCQFVDNGTCNTCVKIRSQRTNNYLVLDATKKVVPGGTQAAAQIFEKVPSGAAFKFKSSSGSYLRVVADDLTMDATSTTADAFTEYDCSSGGLYPNGKGYAAPAGTAPHWKATSTTGPIKSGSGGNGTSCVTGDATSWERFYAETVSCGSTGPACGDGSCDDSETCSSCSADCGTCSGTPARLTLTHASDSGGWSSVAGLTDGDLSAKVSSAASPSCATYDLGGTYTISSARLLEDNDGSWNTGTWKVQYQTGSGSVDAFAYTDTPSAMPAWNTVDFADVPGVSRVTVCMQSVGARIELAEIEVWGLPDAGPVCGDRACNGSETCTSCPWDCDTCMGSQLGLDARPSNTACVAGDGAIEPPVLLSDHPCVASVANPPALAPGVIPYAIAEPFWSDDALKSRYLALPSGTTFNVKTDGDFELPPGAVTIKNFQWQGQYFETRFFVRFTDGAYGAYTYKWNDTQDEAFLVDPIDGDAKTLAGGHVWSYPTEAQCFQCHTSAAGFSLGLETRQLNVNQLYPSTGRMANQFDTLNGIGMLSGNLTSLPPFPPHAQSAASLQMRADAYLHVNCSNCHRPGGPGYGTADYRYDTPFASKNICNQESILPAYPELALIEPGAHDQSVVWLRMSQRTASFMPPIASKVADGEGAALLQQWINSLTGCP
ncbi:uncharacterized protein SOCE26_103680 [Sorangium cellulosum]|uniref:Glucose/Sorbosone dehydrogenase domain-containing protein n=1 Tax=Sorangium cellulosum TaxID=56 RepID=A0A2L0FBE8_SORCE|nr:uncharacterized protein SOCE26_103680 [Sorangium cellulosum]